MVTSWNSYQPFYLADVVYPAQTILLADGDWTRSTADYGNSNCYRISTPFHPSFFIPQRHNGGSNLAFVDGHAKWLAIDGSPGNWSSDIGRACVGPIKFTVAPGPSKGVYWMANGTR